MITDYMGSGPQKTFEFAVNLLSSISQLSVAICVSHRLCSRVLSSDDEVANVQNVIDNST